jgi:hypothetical protein
MARSKPRKSIPSQIRPRTKKAQRLKILQLL